MKTCHETLTKGLNEENQLVRKMKNVNDGPKCRTVYLVLWKNEEKSTRNPPYMLLSPQYAKIMTYISCLEWMDRNKVDHFYAFVAW